MVNKTQTNESEQKFVTVPGGKLAYEVVGQGPDVLCLPSLGDTRREYERLSPVLVENGYRVITTDLRGMGKSRGAFKTHSVPDLTSDIKAILDAEHVERAILVGCSVSGASVGQFAVNYPERVQGLILFSPIMHTGPHWMTFLLVTALRIPFVGRAIWGSYFKTLYPSRPLESDYLEHIKANLKLPGAMKSIADMCMARRIDDQISSIRVPALIYFGSKDPDFKDAQVEADLVKSEVPQAEVIVLDGIGHYPQRECPELVLPKVVEWLRAVR